MLNIANKEAKVIQIHIPKILSSVVELLKEIRLANGALLLEVILQRESHTKFDGTASKPMTWLVLKRPPSVAVLIHDSFRDEIILAEQFRGALMENILELPAGSGEEGVAPEELAVKEVWQEVKLNVSSLTKISEFFVSPGATSEKIFLYYTQVSSLGENGLISGLVQENESIKKHIISVSDALAMLDQGLIQDAKTIIALQWLKNQRKK